MDQAFGHSDLTDNGSVGEVFDINCSNELIVFNEESTVDAAGNDSTNGIEPGWRVGVQLLAFGIFLDCR